MVRAKTLIRVLLAATVSLATLAHESHAQCSGLECQPPPQERPSPQAPERNDNRVGLYIVGGVVLGIIGLMIKSHLFPDSGAGEASPPRRVQLDQPSIAPLPQPSLTLPGRAGGGAGGGAAPGSGGGAPGGTATGQSLRSGFNLPPAGETRFVADEVLLDIPSTVPTSTLDAMAARHGMSRIESTTLNLTRRTLHRWRIDGGGSPLAMLRSVSATERQVAGGQVNFLYELTQDQATTLNADQYAPQKLNVPEAHRLARGNRVLIAVIDSEVDASHPDLAGAISARFEASADDEEPHSHGTGMAGAIAARHSILGVAPQAGLLTVRAFSLRSNSVEGTTFNILKGLDWAATQGARVVNMSFAGPADPRLRDALLKAHRKGMVLIAAAGNAGAKSAPLYPAADPSVIAVTATDARDSLFEGANRGNHIAVAAPGVDILVPAPAGGYQFTTGTSVAAAEVSGAAALLIERNPSLTPGEIRKILMDTAKDLGSKGKDRDFGAGLVNALQAVTAVKPRR